MDDLKVSLRLLLKSPGFTVAAIVVLALGIGLNAAMFSVVYAFTMAGRPFPQADRIVQLYSRDARTTNDYRAFSYPVYQELAARADMFTGLLAHNPTIVGIGDGTESRRAFSVVVSANYFDVLGVPLVQGRTFSAEEGRPGQDIPVAIASHAYWKRTGFDPGLVGRTVRVNERPFTVVGIAPRGFTGTMSVFGPELFFPLGVFHTLANDFEGEAARSLQRADAYNLFLVGRLKDGVAVSAASVGVELFGKSLAQAFPAEHEHQVLSLALLPRFVTGTSPANETVIGTLGAVMMGMTAAVLLTVCLNLASMLLARGRARRKEFAVRLALGGGRGRIVRQLLVEGLLLSLVGGALGVVLGLYAIDFFTTSLSNLVPLTIALDGMASPALVGGSIVFCLLATLGFALGPALKHSRADILTDLKAQTGDDPAPRRWRLVPRNPLVAAQVALSLCLLIAAGLFLRMALVAANTDFGFRADDTVLAEVDSRLGGLDQAHSLDVYARIEERLAALPGVQSASIGAIVPMGMISMGRSVQRAGVNPPQGSKPTTPEAGQAFGAPWNAIGATYFDAMGVSVLQGRSFTPAESFGTGAPLVAMIDETLARKLWPDGSALGQRIQWAAENGAAEPSKPMEVVGIVSTTRNGLFEREPRGAVYVPFGQGFMSTVFFHVRPAAPTDGLEAAVRRELRAAAPGVPLFGVRTFAAHLESAAEYWMLRLATSLFAFFAGMAMVVALVGIYGVTSYAVARRTREIGVRMAVGARPVAVLRLILGESMRTTATGVVVGWVLGLGMGRLLASMFVDMKPFDVWTFALVPVGFVAASIAATWMPARRATEVNPVTALRSE
ncbi:MAG: ABC transporter permease [Acidobacteria bacterium]|nr:ABC transporter permease [Acidobacteriota bacterium]